MTPLEQSLLTCLYKGLTIKEISVHLNVERWILTETLNYLKKAYNCLTTYQLIYKTTIKIQECPSCKETHVRSTKRDRRLYMREYRKRRKTEQDLHAVGKTLKTNDLKSLDLSTHR